MKRVWIFFWSFLLMFLIVEAWSGGNGTNYGMDEEALSFYNKVGKCVAAEDEVERQTIHGRLIRAFELCRKQGGGVKECAERIQKIREKWKEKGCVEDSAWILSYYYNKAVAKVKKMETWLRNLYEQNAHKLSDPVAASYYFAGMSRGLKNLYPGSEFGFTTGTGRLVLEDGEIYFQGWRWRQFNVWREGGILIQTFPGRINFVMDRYNISVYLETEPEHRWEVIDFNLPFDMQSEKILVSLGQGVRISDREIIRLVNIFLHDTVWGVDVVTFFPHLLTKRDLREDFLKAMVEYFTYDNYIAKVRAEAKKQEKQQGGQPSGKTRKKK
jgi:hypothetical protein